MTQASSTSSSIWTSLSDCWSIFQWYVMLCNNLVPKASCIHFNKWDVNLGTRFDTIYFGIPWSQTFSHIYNLLKEFTENQDLTGIKLVHFVRWLTITQIES